MSLSSKLCRAGHTFRSATHSASASCSFSVWTCRRNTQSHLPRVAQPALWRGMIPRAFRKDEVEPDHALPIAERSQSVSERNPGLPLIILGLLAGSFAINIISLRREMANFSRKTETKLALLREVVQKVKNGEDVDVKRLLGTGDPESEREWEEVIQELENTSALGAGHGRSVQRAQPTVPLEGNRPQAVRGAAPVSEKSTDTSGPKFMM